MNDQEVQQHVTQWIENTLSKPSLQFNNLPPCPFSHSALQKNKVHVRYESGARLLPTLTSIAQSWDDSHEVMVVMCDKRSITSNELAAGATDLSEKFRDHDLLVNCDHPDCADPKFKVFSTNGKYAMGVVQKLSSFVEASSALFKRGYYKNVDYADLSHYASFKGNFTSGEEWISTISNVRFHDHHPEKETLVSEVLTGLSQDPKYLPAMINYYHEGADLFDRVCQAPDYYVTRTELSIMERHIEEIAAGFTDETVLIEPGSGNGKKTRLLLNHLPAVVGYIPIDIAKEQLLATAAQIAYEHSHLEIMPVCADFTQPLELPTVSGKVPKKLFYYPGSTIGNQDPQQAVSFLKQLREMCDPGDGLLIGFDLKKDSALLKLAYDDPAGVNRRFILNPVTVMKREFDLDFDVANYQHQVVVNQRESRVEISMKCLVDHTLHLGGEKIEFAEGELIQRAVAYKYSLSAFREMATRAGWQTQSTWMDEHQWFAVQHLSPIK